MFKKYYCIRQHDITDCAAACLAIISKQHGLKISITRIREVAGTDQQGTNVQGIVTAAKHLGLTSKAVKGSKEAFFSGIPLPCIAHVITEEGLLHFVVVHKIAKKKIVIADPAKGLVPMEHEDFLKIWSGVLIFLTPSSTFKKGDETKSIFKRFFNLLIPQRGLVTHIFIASLIYVVFGILSSFYLQFLIDDILPGNLSDMLFTISIGIIALHVFRSVLSFFRSYLLLHLGQKLDLSLLFGYYQHVLNLPFNFFGTRKVGEIVSRFNDASKIREMISDTVLTIMIDTLMAIIGGSILYMQSSYLFMIAVIIAILYCGIVFAFNNTLKKTNEIQMEDNAQLSSFMIESLNGIETIKSFNLEERVVLETEFKFIKFLKSTFKNNWMSSVAAILSQSVGTIGSVVIIWIGAHNVLNGNLTIGQLIAFNALLAYFLDPIQNLIDLQPRMQMAIVASDRLGEILDLTPEKSNNESKKAKLRLNGNIEFKDVDFRYGTRHLVLRNINISINHGEKIALVGESGSGKTTLAKLLIHFYDVEKGSIEINNYNIKDISLEHLREKIAYISQDLFMFSGTIYDNLTLGNSHQLTLNDIIEVCKQTKAHDFINELPLRYETKLEENGSNLSVGQRQRLAIARALLRKPDILVMDEATSNLDSITEKAIESTIHNELKDVTAIIIAHRLSTIMSCDRIYVMKNGSIYEEGTHNELMANKNGVYYSLWKEQIPKMEGV